jgi:hypothetical protein
MSDIFLLLHFRQRRAGLRQVTVTFITFCRVRAQKKIGERAFVHTGSTAKNSLTNDIHTANTLSNFKRLLKTHLFEVGFCIRQSSQLYFYLLTLLCTLRLFMARNIKFHFI